MHWFQKTLTLSAQRRGCHIVTSEVLENLPEVAHLDKGLCHLFLLHTSASLTINENADPDVPYDLNQSLDRIVPESFPFRHTHEGPDDMPAHVKSSLMGASLTLPVSRGQLVLGTWQGLYLNEHRDSGPKRSVFVTLMGV